MVLTKIRRSNDDNDDSRSDDVGAITSTDLIAAGEDDESNFRSAMEVTNRLTGNCTIAIWSRIKVGMISMVVVETVMRPKRSKNHLQLLLVEEVSS